MTWSMETIAISSPASRSGFIPGSMPHAERRRNILPRLQPQPPAPVQVTDTVDYSFPIDISRWSFGEIGMSHEVHPDRETHVERRSGTAHLVAFALNSFSLRVAAGAANAAAAVRQGHFCFIPAHVASNWDVSPGAELLYLSLPPHLFSEDIDPDDRLHQALPTALCRPDAAIASLGRACLIELLDPSYGSAALLQSYTAALAVRLARALVPEQGRPGSCSHIMSPYRLARAKDFIEQNLDQPINVEAIARAAGLSTFHFARNFKRETGLAPYRYLVERRVHRAKMLLLQSDSPICQIALACGFCSQQQFTTTFRQIVGTTPARWRKADV